MHHEWEWVTSWIEMGRTWVKMSASLVKMSRVWVKVNITWAKMSGTWVKMSASLVKMRRVWVKMSRTWVKMLMIENIHVLGPNSIHPHVMNNSIDNETRADVSKNGAKPAIRRRRWPEEDWGFCWWLLKFILSVIRLSLFDHSFFFLYE